MSIKIKVKKNILDNYIRECLNCHNVSSLDMIKHLCRTLAYYLNKYKIDFMNDLDDFKDHSDDTCISVACSLVLLKFIEGKILEQKEDL